MKILTIPYIFGGASHLIPLMVMQHNYIRKISAIKNFFLVSETKHNILSAQGMKVLPLNYGVTDISIENIISSVEYYDKKIKAIEDKAFNYLNPDILLEDICFNSAMLAEKYGIPRISIQRTGMFRNLPTEKRNPKHHHSLEKGMDKIFTLHQNHKTYDFGSEVFSEKYIQANAKIIPGIPSLEILPDNQPNKDSYFYAGPLIVNDRPSIFFKNKLAKFLQKNKDKKKVYITTGLVDYSSIVAYIKLLLKKNYAIITNHDISGLNPNLIFSKKILPLNYVCSKMDLIIHHCGSGMYHYPILNKKPSITIGTQCFDREDIALRLQQLGVSKHTPNPNDDEKYLSIFEGHLDKFENNTLCDLEKLLALREEIKLTKENFNFERITNYVLKQVPA